ncbi:hypothetical protein EJ06DRAFT_552217 [Trichodelitschia bisporula]|uniref:BZIP domain-containing protein n=1 Tax=Trichodelitschia bisporula TaxID=703511 RepID=A0A6G1HIK8_9PEZI|nr:hypothetical protein EJ06DRAFT_552217 [Trichodelitschia bisporula]
MMPEPKDPKANLARIRDNQRRSRARRKEYLASLEAKYRECTSAGITASAEMQAAARRVLDENARLKALLRRKGVSEGELESAVRSDATSESPEVHGNPQSDDLDPAAQASPFLQPGEASEDDPTVLSRRRVSAFGAGGWAE